MDTRFDEEEGTAAMAELDLATGYGCMQKAHLLLSESHSMRAYGFYERADQKRDEAEGYFDDAEEALRRGYGSDSMRVARYSTDGTEALRRLDFAAELVSEYRMRALQGDLVLYSSEVVRWFEQIGEALAHGRKA